MREQQFATTITTIHEPAAIYGTANMITPVTRAITLTTTTVEAHALITTAIHVAVTDKKIVVGTEDQIVAKTITTRIQVIAATTTTGVHVTLFKNVFGTVVWIAV